MLLALVINWVAQALVIVFVVDAILTWIPQIDRRSPIVVALRCITDPIYRPIRKVLPPERTGYIDLSPIIAIIGVRLMARLLISLL